MTTCLPVNEKLNQWLGPEWICTRPGPSGGKLHYIEGKSAINIANDIFGYDGWSSEIKDSAVDFLDVGTDGRVSLGIATTVRITLKNSNTMHEDIGYGTAENMKGKAAAFEKARKESATDGLKRALRMLGNAMGNCLYDKTYLRNITNMARPQIPFIPKDLYRQEHIRKSMQTETVPASSSSTTIISPNISSSPSSAPSNTLKKNDHGTLPQQQQQQQQPIHPPSPPARTTVQSSSLSKQPIFRTTSSSSSLSSASSYQQQQQPQVLLTARDEINVDILTIKKEPPSNMKSQRQPILLSQDSFGLDAEDEAFYAQLADVETCAMKQLQESCQSNRHPPSSSTSHRSSSSSRLSSFSSRPSPSSSSSPNRSTSKSSQSRKRQRP